MLTLLLLHAKDSVGCLIWKAFNNCHLVANSMYYCHLLLLIWEKMQVFIVLPKFSFLLSLLSIRLLYPIIPSL